MKNERNIIARDTALYCRPSGVFIEFDLRINFNTETFRLYESIMTNTIIEINE
jgi:hypothetical protein